MKQHTTPLRPGMTALAAALALSSTPLLAQSVEQAVPSEVAPVMVAPPPPVVTAAPTVALDSSTAAPAPAATVRAPAPTMAPIVHTIEPATPAAPTISRSATTRSTPTRSTPVVRTASPSTTATAPVASVPDDVVAPAPLPAAVPTPVTKAAPAPVAPQPAQTSVDNDILPIAGGAAALLLLGGGAFAIARRKRRADDEDVILETRYVPAADPVAPVVPAAATAPVPPRQQTLPSGTNSLPSGFDISRFGRHTQAAYRGPTPENPSLSLKKRLKIASFYDQRERQAEQGITPAAPARVPAPAVAAHTTDHITVRPSRSQPSFKPVFSS